MADYLADTQHLTTEQHGAYLLLIFAYWRRQQPLPDDDAYLARIAGISRRRWPAFRAALLEMFSVTGGKWIHKRVDDELAHARDTRIARQNAGKSGGRPKQTVSTENQTVSAEKANGKQNESPSPSPSQVPPEAIASAPPTKRPKRREQIAPDRQPSPEDRAFAERHGIGTDTEWPQFVDYHLREGSLLADIPAAWRTWVRNAVKFSKERARPAAGPPVADAPQLSGPERAEWARKVLANPGRNPGLERIAQQILEPPEARQA